MNIQNNQGETTSSERCDYCGAILQKTYYFCLSCAKPYREVPPSWIKTFELPLSEGELIKQHVPQVWRVFWTFAIIIFIVNILCYVLFDQDVHRVYSLIVATICVGIATFVFEIKYWKSLAVQLNRGGFLKKEVWIGLLLLPCLLAINYVYHYMLLKADFDRSGMGTGTLFIIYCLMPSIVEEITFRGLIQHWLTTVLKPWRAILFTSVLFTALHCSIISAPYLFALGCLLGWIKWKTQSLYPAMLIHGVHNAVVVFAFPLLI